MKTMMGAVVIFLTSLAHSAVPIESLCDRYEFAINLRVIALDKKIKLYYPNSNMTPMIEDVSSQGSFFVEQLIFNIEAGGPFIEAYKLSEK